MIKFINEKIHSMAYYGSSDNATIAAISDLSKLLTRYGSAADCERVSELSA